VLRLIFSLHLFVAVQRLGATTLALAEVGRSIKTAAVH
jgi:hypothetical protein